MALVSVITPATRPHLLQEAIASVREQTFKDVEHIHAFDSNYIGPGFLRNELVKQASGEWLVFLDDDDLLDPNYIELTLGRARDTGADLVYTLCRYPPGAEPRPGIVDFDEARLRWANYLPMTVLLRREKFDEVGGFKVTAPYEDWYLWLALMDAKAKFSFLNKTCWTYRLHGNGWKPDLTL